MSFIYTEMNVPSKVVEDVVCDSCQKSTKDKFGWNFEYASLTAHWGYGSSMDDTEWNYHLCEECAKRAFELLGLKEEGIR